MSTAPNMWMSGSAARQLRSTEREIRPVITSTRLSVVQTPAPARGLVLTWVVCILMIVTAFIGAFALNTRQVQGAFELRTVTVELNEVTAREETLKAEVVKASTPDVLRERAENLGLKPATTLKHLDIKTGVITGTAD